MSFYSKFAEFYHRGEWPEFSRTIFELIPALQQKFALPVSGSLLDVACGTGVFLCKMSLLGWDAHGIDQSESMLAIARQNAQEAGVALHLSHGDMRQMTFTAQFDLITCLYDSLNYLLSPEELYAAFEGMQRALKPGGSIVFDMNTPYGLSVHWQAQKCFLQERSTDMVILSTPSYDDERQIASMSFTGFIRRGELWERMDEVHIQRGYPIIDIQDLLQKAGLKVTAILGSIRDYRPLSEDSTRVWFICQK